MRIYKKRLYGKVLIVAFIVYLFSSLSNAEEAGPLELSIGSIRTAAEQAAVGVAIRYKEQIDEEYILSNAKDVRGSGDKGWIFSVSPEIDLQTGEADSFNGIAVKLTGNYVRFRTISIDDFLTPDASKPFNAFPISLGIESNRNFERNSALVEIGYVPFDLTSKWQLGTKTRVAAFLQAGYKHESDDTPADASGGAVDESEEEPDSGLLRLKLDASTELLNYEFSGKSKISLVPRIRLWFDAANSETYHKYEADLKIDLGEDRSFDFRYEDGSGAPNFNEGSQFGGYLTVRF